MPRWSVLPLFAWAVAGLVPSFALAKDFVFGNRSTSCQQAGAYRDKELFADFASAMDNFDATREKRIQATIDGFNADVASLTQGMDEADTLRNRRIAVAVAGIVLGQAADRLATVGVKTALTQAEKEALKAVAGRGAEWTTVFLDYGTTGNANVGGLVRMPISLLLSFTPFAVVDRAWSLGESAMDIATAVAEAEIIKGAARVSAADTKARAEALARKLQMPRIDEINRLKNEIDKQCG